jgi:hypothetical protein
MACMRTKLIVSAALVLASVGLATADEPEMPLMKEGLWQAHTSMTLRGKTTEVNVKMCQTHETQKKEREFSAGLRKKNDCVANITQASPNSFVSENKCQSGPLAGTVSKGTMVFQGDTGYHSETHIQRNGGEDVTVIDSKFVGPCPADMKPGDTVLDNGTKVNLTQ